MQRWLTLYAGLKISDFAVHQIPLSLDGPISTATQRGSIHTIDMLR